jgi:alanine racemase
MNMIVVDVGHIPGVVAGEEAVLLGSGWQGGSQGGSPERLEEITADALAELTGTIHYDVVTRINASLPRVLVDD